MSHPFETQLQQRSGSKCELCESNSNLSVFEVPPQPTESDVAKCAMLCESCVLQIDGAKMDESHWRCLQQSAWSQVPAVQALAWRLLKRLNTQGWAQDLLDQMYLDESLLEWAEDDPIDDEPTLDSNGTRLFDGDTVQVIKDLDVKGTGFVAKRGAIVKNIRLTTNPEHVEGRVNKTTIVLKTQFLKRTA